MKNYKVTFGPFSHTFYAANERDARKKADAILKEMANTLKLFHINGAVAKLEELDG